MNGRDMSDVMNIQVRIRIKVQVRAGVIGLQVRACTRAVDCDERLNRTNGRRTSIGWKHGNFRTGIDKRPFAGSYVGNEHAKTSNRDKGVRL